MNTLVGLQVASIFVQAPTDLVLAAGDDATVFKLDADFSGHLL